MDHGATGFGAYTLVDVETSGLSAERDRVLSVAALTLDDAGRVTEEFHSLLDPGCDPGPVHIHGLTREILRGAPQFEQIRDRLAGLLDGRILVAHNARFDHGFLAGEFGRTGAVLPVRQRLCTLALAQRIAPPARDCTLAGLAAYYGVPQAKAHDALDDTRVLAGVLRALVADAARLGITPPLLGCDPAAAPPPAASRWPTGRGTPKPSCPYAWPGRYVPGDGLVQGMKVVVTGDTATERTALIGLAESAGLEVTGSVSRRTSLLVTNDRAAGSGKARRAAEHGTPVLSEPEFLRLLPGIRDGKPKDGPTTGAPPRTHATADVAAVPGAAGAGVRAGGPSAGTAAPGAVAVTDRAAADSAVAGPAAADVVTEVPVAGGMSARALSRGQVVDLPQADEERFWTVRASWNHTGAVAVDIVAFAVGEDEKVCRSADFVFYNQPGTAGVRLRADGPNAQSIDIALDDLPVGCRRIVIAAALDGAGVTFGDVGAVELDLTPGPEAAPVLHATLDAATAERTLVLGELYLRAETWRIRAVGQGYGTGLADLARSYGVEVDG